MKRLITLGCSVTEGIGVFDIKNQGEDSNQLILQHGWPSILGKKMGFDEVINLGLGGSANSAHIKLLMENEDELKFNKNDEIVLVWLLTSMYRFSFYIDGRIQSFMNDDCGVKQYNDLFKSYINSSSNILLDSLLETKSLIKLLDGYCKGMGYKFFFGTWMEDDNNLLRTEYKNNNNYIEKTIFLPIESRDKYWSIRAGHPNEFGYEYMANELYDWFISKHPNLITKNDNQINLRYLGNPRKY